MFKSLLSFSFATFLSRILGFVRDLIIARFFGSNEFADAFFVAFKIPNFFRRLFAEGAFIQAFIPVFAEVDAKGKSLNSIKEHNQFVNNFLNQIFTRLFLILLIFTIFGIITAEYWIYLFAPGFNDEVRFGITVKMFSITFPYLMLISLCAFYGGILNSRNYFGVVAFTPIFLNACLISAAFIANLYFNTRVDILAWGVLIAGIVQLLFLMPFVWRLGLLPRFSWKKNSYVKKIFKLMLPAMFGTSVAQINLLIDTIIASFLITGSISWLYYSGRLMEFPLGIFGVGLATIILPKLAKNYQEGKFDVFNANVNFALKLTMIFGLASVIGLFFLAEPLVHSLFNYGNFTNFDTQKTAQSLRAFSFALIGFIGIKIFAQVFYAQQDIKTPVKVAILAILVNTSISLSLMHILGHVALASASAISSSMNALILLWLLLRQKRFTFEATWTYFLSKVLLANTLLAASLYLLQNYFAFYLLHDTTELRLLSLLGVITIAIIFYFSCLLVLRINIVALLKTNYS